jgi:hypothetical protein
MIEMIAMPIAMLIAMLIAMPWRREESMDAIAKIPIVAPRTPMDHVRPSPICPTTSRKIASPALDAPLTINSQRKHN